MMNNEVERKYVAISDDRKIRGLSVKPRKLVPADLEGYRSTLEIIIQI